MTEAATARGAVTSRTTVRAGRAVLLAVAGGVSVANVYYAQPLLGQLHASLGIGRAGLGLVTTITQAGYLLGLVLVVPLGDLMDRRRLIALQALAAALGLATAAAAPHAWLFFLSSAVAGAASAVVQVIVAFAASASEPGQRGRVVGIVTSGIVIGILLARTVSGLVASQWGWRSVYAIAAASMAALAITLVRLLPEDSRRKSGIRYHRVIGSVLTLTLGNRVFRTRSLIGLLMFGSFGAVWGSIALPLSAAPWHLSPAQIGLFGLAGAGGALGAARAGRLADSGRAQWVSGAALSLLALSWLAIWRAPSSLVLLAAGVIALDLAGQAIHVTNQHLIVETDPAAASRLIGSYMVYYSIGTGSGAIAATTAYAHGGWTAVAALGAAFSLLALLIWALDHHLSRLNNHRRELP